MVRTLVGSQWPFFFLSSSIFTHKPSNFQTALQFVFSSDFVPILLTGVCFIGSSFKNYFFFNFILQFFCISYLVPIFLLLFVLFVLIFIVNFFNDSLLYFLFLSNLIFIFLIVFFLLNWLRI